MKNTKNKIIKSSAPSYPTAPYASPVGNGSVGIMFDISREGRPYNIKVVEASPPRFFTKSAISALKNYSFFGGNEELFGAYEVTYFSLHE